MNPQTPKRSWRRILIIVGSILLLAYGVQVTKINLEEPLEPQRQSNLVGLLRELAKPDFFTYDQVTRTATISMNIPCPEKIVGSQVNVEGRQITLAPNCATTTQDRMTLSGAGFPPNVRGAIRWLPAGANTARSVADFRADAAGNFSVQFTLPTVRESPEPQQMEVIELLDRRISGLSAASRITLERIVETILMALMASTLGTILAIPISFLAARNLMVNVGTPLAAIMLAVILAPLGGWVGGQIGGGLVSLATGLAAPPGLGLGTVLAVAVAVVALVGSGISLVEGQPTTRQGRVLFTLRGAGVLILVLFALTVLGKLGAQAGTWAQPRLGVFGFLGNFVTVISDLFVLLMPGIVGFIGVLMAFSWGSRTGQEKVDKMGAAAARWTTAGLTVLGTGVLVGGLLSFLNWLCFLGMCNRTPADAMTRTLLFAGAGLGVGLLMALLSLRRDARKPVAIGFATYTLIRGFLNALRSIEPIMMGFVFVVWVGIGPFAGVMTLILNTVADLGKLFSEQVEDIAEGPLEAITASGANRLQTIVFAVWPQIVPQYIAFIFYRWDINVRLSTIIGFVGGGGIGLVLQRSVNQLRYSEAAVMVIAIAVVVTILDNVSSRVRSRII